MEAVIFDGKEYTKASVVAKKFGYTADYLGQLCRGKKVDARMVGRSWYINIDSIDAHRDTRYKVAIKTDSERTTSLGPVDAKKPRSHYLSRIDVEPILKKKTISLYQEKNGALRPVPVKYEADEYSLIPRVNTAAVSKNIVIKPAGAEELKVKGVEKQHQTVFKAEELPEVYLRGQITVKGLEEAADAIGTDIPPVSEEVKIEPEIKPSRMEVEAKPRLVKIKLSRKTSVLKTPDSQSDPITEVSIIRQNAASQPFKKTILVNAQEKVTVSVNKQPPVVGSPTSKSAQIVAPRIQSPSRPVSFSPESVKTKPVKRQSPESREGSWLLSGVVLFSGMAIAVAVLSVTLEISATSHSYELHPKVDFSRLQAAVSLVKNFAR